MIFYSFEGKKENLMKSISHPSSLKDNEVLCCRDSEDRKVISFSKGKSPIFHDLLLKQYFEVEKTELYLPLWAQKEEKNASLPKKVNITHELFFDIFIIAFSSLCENNNYTWKVELCKKI